MSGGTPITVFKSDLLNPEKKEKSPPLKSFSPLSA